MTADNPVGILCCNIFTAVVLCEYPIEYRDVLVLPSARQRFCNCRV